MGITTGTNRQVRQYLPIYLETLQVDTILDFDLYIASGPSVVLYRAARLPFGDETRRHLLESNVTRLFVSASERRAYQQYLEANLPAILNDTGIRETVRAGIVYESAKFLVGDLFADPMLGENITRCKELVDSTVGFILTGRTAFNSLLKVMSFDYSTYTHSVNVCTLAVSLAQYLGNKNPRDLAVLGTGALLHDVGKTKIPNSVLNKIEPLTADELDLIRKHPEWGQEIIKETNLIDNESYFPIIQHHERENESGYPLGTSSRHIHPYGKITAIADVFDAMTTRRIYRPAIEPYPALETMFASDGAFDRDLLEKFTRMLGPSELDNLC